MNEESRIPQEVILSKIYLVRGQKVMLDRDLANLYGLETRVLKQAVRRNIQRFPKDFMFEMSKTEFNKWRSQFVMSSADKLGLRHQPFCFTEPGVAMLSSVLNSETAIEMNIHIMRAYIRIREMYQTNQELILKINEIEKRVGNQDHKISQLFQYLKQFIQQNEKPRKQIGYKSLNSTT